MSSNTNHSSMIVDMSLCMELSHLTHIHVFLCSLVLAQWSVSATRSLTLFSDHSGWRQRRSRSQVTTSPLKHHRQQPRLPPWTRSSSRPRCDDHAYESSQATTAEESAAIGIEICTNSNNAPAPPPPTNPAPVLRDLVVARQGAPPSNPDPMPVDPLEEGIAEDQVPLELPVSEESVRRWHQRHRRRHHRRRRKSLRHQRTSHRHQRRSHRHQRNHHHRKRHRHQKRRRRFGTPSMTNGVLEISFG